MTSEWDAHLRHVAAEVAAAMRRQDDFGTHDADHAISAVCDRMAADAAFARAVYTAVSAMARVDAVYCNHVAELIGESVVIHLIHEVREENALLKLMPTEGRVH